MTSLVDRLAALRVFAAAPRTELEWLATHGTLRTYEPEAIVATASDPLEALWIILSGHIVVLADRGSGPRKVMEWYTGGLSGILPYSRMRTPPGNVVAIDATQMLELNAGQFPTLIRQCHHVTAACVHAMLDRARHFTTTDLQDEKMQSLGRLAAGLAHELNNPASALSRSAAALRSHLTELDQTAQALGAAGFHTSQREAVDRFRSVVRTVAPRTPSSALEQADREEAVAGWLASHGLDEGAADSLSRGPATLLELDQLASLVDAPGLATVVRYLAAESEARALTGEIDRAASRISDLVAAVKRFTYLDQAAVPKPVDIGAGLRDTLTILKAKARSKSIDLMLDVPPGLPPVPGFGGELNQVWMNLIDNAIDAAPRQGHVSVTAAHHGHSVVVRVVDDGPGIPEDVRAHIFDPFFTTKPPGEGIGLGLDIARHLVYRHEGDIEVTSVPGKTEFVVTVPTDWSHERAVTREGRT